MTTLAAGNLSLSACGQPSVADQSADTPPSRVASAMQTPDAASTPAEPDTLHTTSNQTTLTARGFMEYLDPGQREQLLGAGLNLGDLTWAQQLTALKLLESLFDQTTYETATSILRQITHNDTDAGMDHTLRFNARPTTGTPWEVILEGPILGFVADVDSDSGVRIASAHLILDPDTFTDPTMEPPVSEAAAEIITTAEELLDSLSPEQMDQLIVPEGSTGRGLRGAQLSDTQKELLLKVTANWITVADESTVKEKRAELSRTIDETFFTWAGTTGAELSFRVHGPAIHLECSVEPAGSDTGPRIYSEFRDPDLSP